MLICDCLSKISISGKRQAFLSLPFSEKKEKKNCTAFQDMLSQIPPEILTAAILQGGKVAV